MSIFWTSWAGHASKSEFPKRRSSNCIYQNYLSAQIPTTHSRFVWADAELNFPERMPCALTFQDAVIAEAKSCFSGQLNCRILLAVAGVSAHKRLTRAVKFRVIVDACAFQTAWPLGGHLLLFQKGLSEEWNRCVYTSGIHIQVTFARTLFSEKDARNTQFESATNDSSNILSAFKRHVVLLPTD